MLTYTLTVLLLVGAQQFHCIPLARGNNDIGDVNTLKNDQGEENIPQPNEFVEDVKKSMPHWPMSVKSKYISVLPEQLPETEVDQKEAERNQLISTRSTKMSPPASPDLDIADYSIPYNRGKFITSDPKDPKFVFPELPQPTETKVQEFREADDESGNGKLEMLTTRALGTEDLSPESEDYLLNDIDALPETTNSIEVPLVRRKRDGKTPSDDIQAAMNADQKLPADTQASLNAATKSHETAETAETDLDTAQKLPENIQTDLNKGQNLPENIQTDLNKGQNLPENIQPGLNKAQNLPENIQTGLYKAQNLPENIKSDLNESVKLPGKPQTGSNEKLPSDTKTDKSTESKIPEVPQSGSEPQASSDKVEPATVKPTSEDAETEFNSPDESQGMIEMDSDEDDKSDDSLFATPALLMKIMRLAGIPAPGKCSVVIIRRKPISPFQFLQQQQSGSPITRGFFDTTPFRAAQSMFPYTAQDNSPYINQMPFYNQQAQPENHPLSFLFNK